jgi:integrase
MRVGLPHEDPARETDRSRMGRSKRQYGTGCLLKRRRSWAIRWRELEIAPDGTRKKVLRFESLGNMSAKEARETLTLRLAKAGSSKTPIRSRVLFRTVADEWKVTVVPMYKHSTQKHRHYMLTKHLMPRFGDRPICDITRQEIQAYVAHLTAQGYAPKSIDHIHDVLSAILRTAVKWGHLQENPARGVDLPALKCVRPKWALTVEQARALIEALAPLGRTMVGLAVLTGLRRGELFALRWKHVDETRRVITVQESVYDGKFDTPKTEAGVRQIPLSDTAFQLLREWKARVGNAEPEGLVFGTRLGTTISPNNVLNRLILPTCRQLGLPHATWLTFRRTYSSWSHERGVPGKVVAQLMGHANVDTTLNVYTQVLDGSVRDAVQKVGDQLFTIVHRSEPAMSTGN